MFGALGLGIFIGNLFTLVAFTTDVKLLRMRSSYFLINLACADFIIGAVTIPMYIALLTLHINNKTYQSAYTAIDIASGFSSVFTLSTIALERLYVLCNPIQHRKGVNGMCYCASIASVWILALLLSVLYFLYTHAIVQYQAFFYAMLSALTACILGLCTIYTAIWYKIKNRFSQSVGGHENKFAVTLFTITATFVLTWLPFHLLNVINYFCDFCLVASLPHWVLFFSKFLHYANSFINPVIYSFRLPQFRRTVYGLVGIGIRRKKYAYRSTPHQLEEIPLQKMTDTVRSLNDVGEEVRKERGRWWGVSPHLP